MTTDKSPTRCTKILYQEGSKVTGATQVVLGLLWEGGVLGSLSAKARDAEFLGQQSISLYRRQSETELSLGAEWGRAFKLGSVPRR